ncbi:pyridoxamine 5'-phosphate oxidase family protein [Corynebacterium sanguinis]|uniref:pyridoxamine 5'-phosphate oxidase family protein n=1 Tax=Corynebacterium sanguinis TaxID=2594913 RepID=UPI00223BC45A|nr:pyridoxamine 5'-phosphate oxidase family protein [Corynebacterium sanguinis]MCT1425867.1 pyridoxamine 5'-phosphate oxidase family protein [Corynebacterium sanguinis]MCT1805580.1 pyridoxamine 5'-phosphate oxidase family protein [Corynebacterium sanguinis]MCT2159067.1 pyridoxamine 5'-phosphate oxidase family protein [Corynebacterium sanguinis]
MSYLDSDYLRGLSSLTGSAPAFDTANLPDDPFELFAQWFEAAVAAGCDDVRAATVATVDENGVPDARVMNLMELSDTGFCFGTGADSTKVEQLSDSPVAALNFWWQPMNRAVRVRGAARLDGASDEHFNILRVEPVRLEFFQAVDARNATRVEFSYEASGWVATVLDH